MNEFAESRDRIRRALVYALDIAEYEHTRATELNAADIMPMAARAAWDLRRTLNRLDEADPDSLRA